jgi:hypothetical protein
METILEFIDKHCENGIHCYKTRKVSLDISNTDTVASENSDQDTVPQDTSGKIAESDTSRVNTVRISEQLIRNTPPYFKYFLDGSRHTYKVDDIAIGSRIYPIIAGQIVVGCCERNGRDSFRRTHLHTAIVIALPKPFHTKKGKEEDFLRLYCERLNDHMSQNRYIQPRNISISKILLYPTDGPSVGDANDKNRYKNSGIARIQNEMTDAEQLLVHHLCEKNLISAQCWLIKDGSIQYNPSYSNMDRAQWNTMRANYRYVVGVSKSFDPDLLKNYEQKKMSQIIADLKPFERTKAYKYQSEQSPGTTFAIWYIRLRKSDFRDTRFSDIVKCEMVMQNASIPIKTQLIDVLSANLIREAYPVCFGSDARWANHLYPIYLTETFCKAQYIDNNVFLGLF